MNRTLLIVMAAALVLIGPAMFVIARMHALDVGFSAIRRGESPAQVVAALGRPQRQVSLAPAAKVDLEYRYRAWPLPGVWVVDFSHGQVVRTGRR